ncbi:MAG TPA: amino acid ABC transporter substrate-binding protein [Burkholderiales bacterium]|nr:amino acid ABC transporter substrate-binding protein [Burkholderiales bacterium]
MKRLAVAVALLVLPALVHAQGLDGALRKIRDSKTITVAYRTDSLPFSFNDEKNQPAGYTVDLCKRVVASIEQQLKIQGLKVNWMPVTVQNRLDVVAKKQADMECGSTTVTLSRMETVDFSNYVFVDSTGVLVRNESGVKTFTDLAGKKIAAIAGTTNERALNAALKARLVNGTVVTVKSRDEGLEALEKGTVDGFASDKILIAGLSVKVRDASKYTMLPDDLSVEPYGIALPRGDWGMRLAVNRGLAQIYRTPEIVDIFNRWFGAFGKPTVLLEAVYFLGVVPE